jgi:hypothetical protein
MDMVQNLDSLMRRALLGGFFVLCSYSAFAPTSRAVAQDRVTNADYATNPAAAHPTVRQVAGYRYEVPQQRVQYFWGHRRSEPVFDRWYYVKQAVICLHSTPLLADMPKIGHYHVLYPAYPRNAEARAVRVKSPQQNSVPGVVSLRSNFRN